MPGPLFPIIPVAPTNDATELEQNTEHANQAAYRLLDQFQDKARFRTIIDIYTEAFQELEDVFWDLYTKRRLDTAEGDQLRILGRIVGLVKGTTTDVDFRVLVAARIRVLLSRGTFDDLLRIMTIVLGGPSTRIVYEVFPAMIRVELTAVPTFSTIILGRLLRAAKAAGVRLDIDIPPPSGDWFTFNTVAGGGSTALGFMNIAGSSGGQFGQAA